MMKHTKAAIRAAALLMALACIGCGGEGEREDTAPESTADPVTEPVAPAALTLDASFTLVRPENAGSDVINAVTDLRMAIKRGSALDLAPASDWYNTRQENVVFPQTEVLIGETNRAETIEAIRTLRHDDFVITAASGKLVIAGGSDAATCQAVNYFISHYAAQTEFRKEELYRYTANYAVDDVLLNGVSLSVYTLVYPASQKSVYVPIADAFNARMLKLCGRALTVADDRTEAAQYEIILGPAGRSGVPTALTDPLAYAATMKGTKLYLNAGGTYAMTALVNDMLSAYLPENASGTVTVGIPDGVQEGKLEMPAVPLEAEADVRIMSSNILFDGTLEGRLDVIAEQYMKYYPDVIGMQEVNATGQKLFTRLGDFYAHVASELPGGARCSTPILYRKDKYTLVESGCQLYDSRATDTKSMAWIVLENKETGKKLALLNSHSSLILASYNMTETNAVEGEQWRVDNMRQLLEKKDELRGKYGDIPVFATGDFNAKTNSASYRAMTAEGTGMVDSAKVAQVSGVTKLASYHNAPGKAPVSGLPIDFIFTTSDVVDVRIHNIPTDADAVAMSDHCPVYVDARLK